MSDTYFYCAMANQTLDDDSVILCLNRKIPLSQMHTDFKRDLPGFLEDGHTERSQYDVNGANITYNILSQQLNDDEEFAAIMRPAFFVTGMPKVNYKLDENSNLTPTWSFSSNEDVCFEPINASIIADPSHYNSSTKRNVKCTVDTVTGTNQICFFAAGEKKLSGTYPHPHTLDNVYLCTFRKLKESDANDSYLTVRNRNGKLIYSSSCNVAVPIASSIIPKSEPNSIDDVPMDYFGFTDADKNAKFYPPAEIRKDANGINRAYIKKDALKGKLLGGPIGVKVVSDKTRNDSMFGLYDRYTDITKNEVYLSYNPSLYKDAVSISSLTSYVTVNEFTSTILNAFGSTTCNHEIYDGTLYMINQT